MSDSDERVKDALAAYLDHLELGGPKPDTSHLSDTEVEELQQLIGALDMTEGVAFGLGREAPTAPPAPPSVERPEISKLVVATLREALPADVRMDSDPTRIVSGIGGFGILDAWIVGSFGGRVRVWLLETESAHELESNDDCLIDLGRVFGMFSDTAAVALVAKDLTCLIVQPEDCAPKIHIPSGSLVSRRYKQPIRPVGEAVFEFLNELIPYWDPVPAFDRDAGLTIDVPAVGQEFATTAIDEQRGIGERARKGNPKKDALLALGKKEISALSKLTNGLFDGSVDPEEIEQRIERLARNP
jgi:hypothetical protein